jgi:subfamily B ATP-binding cassette protein MsbA
MKIPDNRVLLRGFAIGLAVATVALFLLWVVERHRCMSAVERDLVARRDALSERLEVLVRAEGRRLLSIDPDQTGLPPDLNLVAGEQLLMGVRRVGSENLYTAIVDADRPSIVVAVLRSEAVYLVSHVPLSPVLDALAEVGPVHRGRIHLTNAAGRPVLTWPERRAEATEHQKYRRASEALDSIAAGKSGQGNYKDLDDRDAVGSWCASAAFHGGIVVEQQQRVAFAPVRGPQPWHLAGGLLVLTSLLMLARMVLPRVKFTHDVIRLYAYARRYWWVIGLAMLAMGVYACGNMIRLTLMKTVFDDVLLGKGAGAVEALKSVLYVLAVIVVLMAVASWFKEYLSEYVTQAIVNDVRCALSAHLITLDMGFFDRQKAGELMSRLSNDVSETRKALNLVFGEFLQEPLMLIGALGAALITNWRLTLLIFVGMPLIVWPIYKLGRLVKKYSKRRQVQQGVVTEVMMQTVTGIRIVKGFQREDFENEKLRKASRKLLAQSVRVGRTNALSHTVVDLMNSIGGLLVLAVGGTMVIYGTAGASAADLATLSVILAQMYKPVKVLTRTYNKIQESMAGAERIFEIMDQRPTVTEKPDARPFVRPEREIAFEDVTFAYAERPVLRNVSFCVRAGEVVGLVGETGAGKSTVTDLLARFYDPTGGRITIDGVDLRDHRLADIRRGVSGVRQDAFLFNASVHENILYGNPKADREEVVEAARLAAIKDEIDEMEQGFDTEVGDRGARISGGQRQRLTIARGILKDAPVLILDEATSALDSQTEAEVQANLEKLRAGRTTFVIAHRLSTISRADRILVFKDGELVEEGNHEELIAKQGAYHAMHQIQYASATTGPNGAGNGGARPAEG